jgi:hypothetical protein
MDQSAADHKIAPADASQRLMDSVSPSIFKIEADGSSGTGWMYDENTIATNYHVIENRRHITAIGQDGKRYRLGAKVVFDHQNDVALLTFVGEKPSFAKPLALGNPQALNPGDPLTTIGHPNGGALTSYKGIYKNNTSWPDWIAAESPQIKNSRLRKYVLDQLPGLRSDVLESKLVVYRMDTGDNTHGCSGGPVFNQNMQVVSLHDRVSRADTFIKASIPVDKLRQLGASSQNGSSFEHRFGHYEMGLVTYVKRADHDPLSFTIDTAGLMGSGLAASRLIGYSTDPMCLISRGSALKTSLWAAGGLAILSYNDLDGFRRSTETADTLKYGFALGADATMAGGFISRYLGVLGSNGLSRASRLGTAAMLIGAAMRLGCEFIPNNYVVDIGDLKSITS